MKPLSLALAAALAATALTPAHAARSATFEVEVAYSADQLDTKEGAKQVLAAIVDAAERECFRDTFGIRLRTSLVEAKCVEPAVKGAVARIGHKNLTDAFNASYGQG